MTNGAKTFTLCSVIGPRLYLLDTCVLCGLGRDRIAQIDDLGYALCVSPFAVWELMEHIDNPEDYTRKRAELLKVRHTRILDDPRAEFHCAAEIPVGDTNLGAVLLRQVLNALEESSTMNAFQERWINDGRGFRYSLEDAPRAIRRQLREAEEPDFVDYLERMVGHLNSGEFELDSDEGKHKTVLTILSPYEHVARQVGENAVDMHRSIRMNGYMHSAYVFERAMEYRSKPTKRIDSNDWEDAMMCRHLHLDRPMTLVTSDKATHCAVSSAKSRLTRLGKACVIDSVLQGDWLRSIEQVSGP